MPALDPQVRSWIESVTQAQVSRADRILAGGRYGWYIDVQAADGTLHELFLQQSRDEAGDVILAGDAPGSARADRKAAQAVRGAVEWLVREVARDACAANHEISYLRTALLGNAVWEALGRGRARASAATSGRPRSAAAAPRGCVTRLRGGYAAALQRRCGG